ncbi:MAG: glycosyltransferase family 2 protein [Eubacteriales bacterium]|nr:glycosyltransferase family 2 protein [Eubacteriales bacterium]
MNDFNYDIIIPVYNPGEKFREVIEMLKKQTILPNRVIIMETVENESKVDINWDIVEKHLVNVKDFDHAGTRRRAVTYSKADYFLMMTQDAIPGDEHLAEELLNKFNENTAMCYARQTSDGKDKIEELTRSFNYPDKTITKTIDDLPVLGIKTYFASDVCCMYRREIYDRVGGFVERAVFNEDMLMSASCMKAGYSVVYSAEAVVIHSHKLKLMDQLHRNFDNGASQAEHPEVFAGIKSEGEGMKLVKTLIVGLMNMGYEHLIPVVIFSSAFKLIGFKLGQNYKRLPRGIVRRLALNKRYFE